MARNRMTLGWKLHGDGRAVAPGAVVAPDERLSWTRTLGIGVQHVLAMFGATVLVPLLTGFPPTTTIFFSGIGTIAFVAFTRNRVPSYLGSSFAFISPVLAAKTNGGIPVALGGILVAGVVLFLVGLVIDRVGPKVIEWLMPPLVTGAIVALIGLNLAPVAATNFTKQPGIAIVTLLAILLVAVGLRGFFGRLAIFIGVVAGEVVAAIAGKVSFAGVRSAKWFGSPHFTLPHFQGRAILLILPVVVVLIAENTGHVKAVGTMTERNLNPDLGRAYMGDGFATAVAGLFGGSGTTTYAENIGVMAVTRVYSTAAYIVAGVVAVLLGLVPKFGALILTIPIGVLGGATTVLYGMIAVLGGRIWVEGKVDFRDPVNLLTAAVAIIVGAGNYTGTIGKYSFNGIALGAFGAIVAYRLLRATARWSGVAPGEAQRDQAAP